MKSTPPRARSTAAMTLGAVCPLYSATRSARETSLKISGNSISLSFGTFPVSSLTSFLILSVMFFLISLGISTTSIFTSISPTMRATTVFPVPGLPKKRMWKDCPCSELSCRPSRHALSFTRPKSLPIVSFTLSKPTSCCSWARTGASFFESCMIVRVSYTGASGKPLIFVSCSLSAVQSVSAVASTMPFHCSSETTWTARFSSSSISEIMIFSSRQVASIWSEIMEAVVIITSSP
mmetsp:Transcript_59540/g.160455  ORF Transcript_59540/g.160455 Transcript_59540/m.160455 type:complete len:236 (+) Transcript_59540:1276-1983(+)